jgi:hypothetical protein
VDHGGAGKIRIGLSTFQLDRDGFRVVVSGGGDNIEIQGQPPIDILRHYKSEAMEAHPWERAGAERQEQWAGDAGVFESR